MEDLTLNDWVNLAKNSLSDFNTYCGTQECRSCPYNVSGIDCVYVYMYLHAQCKCLTKGGQVVDL